MSHFEEQFKAVLAKWLRDVHQLDVAVDGVDSYQQRSYEVGFCDTCSYTKVVIDIHYHDNSGWGHTFTYEGSLDELLTVLP